ncbi:MAG: hypothetical protein AMS22_11115 [Thiotrichales bacterium SG8_50]|nr:MAG: hypothetical protein AMS22_11115 [Thiotrichales bacterium SG8_50]
MTTGVQKIGSAYQVTLPNGQIVKSENPEALKVLLGRENHNHKQMLRYREAWNAAAELAGPRFVFYTEGRGYIKDKNDLALLRFRNIESSIGSLGKNDSVFLAAMVSFEKPNQGRHLLERTGCTSLREIAEALSPEQRHCISRLFNATG